MTMTTQQHQIEQIAKATTHHIKQHYKNHPQPIRTQLWYPAWHQAQPAFPHGYHRTGIQLLQSPALGTTILTIIYHQHHWATWRPDKYTYEPHNHPYSDPNYLTELTDFTDKTLKQYLKNHPQLTPSPPCKKPCKSPK